MGVGRIEQLTNMPGDHDPDRVPKLLKMALAISKGGEPVSDNVYVTESGRTLRLRPVKEMVIGKALAKIEAEFRLRGELLDVPTYTTSVGETFPHEYDMEPGKTGKNTLDVPDDEEQTKVNHAAWDAYQDATTRLAAAQGQRRIEITLDWGVADFDIPDDGWRETLIRSGVDESEIPTDPHLLKVYYLQNWLLGDAEIQMLVLEISAMNSVPSDQRELFRQAIRNQMGDAFRSRAGDLAKAFAPKGGVADQQPALSGIENSEGVGAKA